MQLIFHWCTSTLDGPAHKQTVDILVQLNYLNLKHAKNIYIYMLFEYQKESIFFLIFETIIRALKIKVFVYEKFTRRENDKY